VTHCSFYESLLLREESSRIQANFSSAGRPFCVHQTSLTPRKSIIINTVWSLYCAAMT
jgi:hypothetical protein